MEILFLVDSCRLELPFFSVGIALFLIWFLDCFVYHLPLFDFLNLITIHCGCQYFVKRFLKYFFVPVNLLTLHMLSQCIVIVNAFFDIFRKNFTLFYQTNVRLFYTQLHPVRTDQERQNICSDFGKMGKNRRFVMGRTKN